MSTKVDEIADGIYRISTWDPDTAPPAGFTFNQFLVDAEQPLLYHTGARGMFPLVSEAIARIMPVERLRWISFGHNEADECGAMNQFLAAAPNAQVVHGPLGVAINVNDLADRTPVTLNDGEVLDLGDKRIRMITTPPVPHCWDAIALFEETTSTLFAGDLFTHVGDTVAITDDDIVGPAMDGEAIFRATSLTPETVVTIERLAELSPATLAVMHGASYRGDGARALKELAAAYDERYFARA
jgi:flavorubredoxin